MLVPVARLPPDGARDAPSRVPSYNGNQSPPHGRSALVASASGVPVGADEAVETNATVVEPTIRVTETGALMSENATFTGETTLAPGSEVRVTIRSDSEVEPGFRKAMTVVQPDGTFTVQFDLARQAPDDEFEIDARGLDRTSVQTEASGTLRESSTPTATATATATATQTATSTPVTTPGFGIVVALVALVTVAARLTDRLRLARRDRPGWSRGS